MKNRNYQTKIFNAYHEYPYGLEHIKLASPSVFYLLVLLTDFSNRNYIDDTLVSYIIKHQKIIHFHRYPNRPINLSHCGVYPKYMDALNFNL